MRKARTVEERAKLTPSPVLDKLAKMTKLERLKYLGAPAKIIEAVEQGEFKLG